MSRNYKFQNPEWKYFVRFEEEMAYREMILFRIYFDSNTGKDSQYSVASNTPTMPQVPSYERRRILMVRYQLQPIM